MARSPVIASASFPAPILRRKRVLVPPRPTCSPSSCASWCLFWVFWGRFRCRVLDRVWHFMPLPDACRGSPTHVGRNRGCICRFGCPCWFWASAELKQRCILAADIRAGSSLPAWSNYAVESCISHTCLLSTGSLVVFLKEPKGFGMSCCGDSRKLTA